MTTPAPLAVDVLGDLRATREGQAVPIGRGLQAALLLFFVLHRGTVVSTGLLQETFWPEGTVGSVHTGIKMLRRVLEPDRRRGDGFELLVQGSSGYKLVLADDRLDASIFETAVTRARSRLDGDAESARRELRQALALWHGDAYLEARGRYEFADEEIRRLDALRDAARETLFEAEIRCGAAATVSAQIESFYADPGRAGMEPRLLLRAYAEMGQWAKAATVYEGFCEEQEQEPSDEFTAMYGALLDRRPALPTPPRFSEVAAGRAVEDYRQWMREELQHSDVRWVVRAPQGAVTLRAAELFTPLYVDSGPSQLAAVVGPLSLEALVARSDRVLLIGGSGRGKSTFLQQLGRTAATEPDGPIPLLIRCRDLVGGAWAKEAAPDWRSLRAEIEATFARESLALTVDDLDDLARAGGVIWLVDALNEVPADADRAKLANMLTSAARHWSSCKWVVTSSSTITAESLPLGFEVAEVAQWVEDDMRSFLRSLVRLSSPVLDEDAVTERADAILDRVFDHPDPAMRRLAGSPLFLTAMAVLDLAGRPPAESRADLLESITSWLVEDRMETLQRSIGSALQVDEILRALAYHMVADHAGVAAQVGRLAAATGVAHLFPGGRDAALDFVTQAAAVGGVLAPRGVGDIGFSQDLYRDYLAAKHLAGKTDGAGEDGWWSVLKERLDDPSWRDVLSFVPARLLHLGRERVDLFFERFGESCHDTSYETRTRRVALGGQILRDLRPLGYADASHIPAWCDAVAGVRRLFEVVSDRPDLETKFEAAAAYGREGDPRLKDAEAAWSWLPGGICTIGAQASDPTAPGFDRDAAPWEAPGREVTLARFAIHRFPITVAEYEEFVEDGGYDDLAAELWSDDGWAWKASTGVDEPLDWADQLGSPNTPVVGVSWYEAAAFTAWLSKQEPSTELRCQLPTEAQWEFAARRGVPAGKQFPWGNRMTWGPAAEANWAGCFLRRKSPVGMFPASTTPDGVADLFGNVEEWCRDGWSDIERAGTAAREIDLTRRVVRGGSTIRFSRLCRPSYRSRIFANHRYLTVGFRPVLEKVGR